MRLRGFSLRFSRTVRSAAYLSVIGVFVWSSIALSSVRASNESPWSAGPPEFSTEQSIPAEELHELRKFREGHNPHAECISREIKIRALIGFLNKYHDSCWYSTSIGMMSDDGLYVLKPGTDLAGEIKTTTHSKMRSRLYPTANPDIFVEISPTTGAGGTNWKFHKASELRFTEERTLLGYLNLRYATSPVLEMKHKNGFPMIMTKTTTWWSADSRYLLVWHEEGVVYRVDMQSFKVTSVSVASANIKLPGSAALSGSGRYAAVAIHTGVVNNLDVIDYESCESLPGEFVTELKNCTINSFKPLLQANIPSYKFAELPRFYGEHTLGFYHRPYGSNGSYTQYVLQAHGTVRQDNKYLALGDSYSSGEGAGSYLPGTDSFEESTRNMCHTSTKSYPYLINRQLELHSFFSIACSGATLEDYASWSQYSFPSKLYFPGVDKQRNPIGKIAPTILTVGLSGNDIGFEGKLKKCLTEPFHCFSTYESRKEIALEIQKEHPILVNMYGDIFKRMGPNPRLYAIGYPQIASSDESSVCATNVKLNLKERQMAQGLIEYLNAVIQSAANQAGAYYVDTEDALLGHKLCETSSAAVAVNGLTFGSDGNRLPIGNASFHPNELGHELIKNTIMRKTNNFTAAMPDKQPKNIPNPDEFEFLNAPKDGGPVRNLLNNTSGELSLVVRGVTLPLIVKNPIFGLKADSLYEMYLHSEPVYLGSTKTDGAGTIDTELTIPEDTEPGLHTIHVLGLNENNQPVDVYQHVYIAASKEDFDGDGIPDVDEPCGGYIQESGIDEDKDGVDDACDAIITKLSNDPEEPDTTTPPSSSEPSTPDQPTEQKRDFTSTGPVPGPNVIASSKPDSSPATAPQQPKEPTVLSAADDPTDIQSATEESSDSIFTRYGYMFVIGITLLLILGYSVVKYGKQKS